MTSSKRLSRVNNGQPQKQVRTPVLGEAQPFAKRTVGRAPLLLGTALATVLFGLTLAPHRALADCSDGIGPGPDTDMTCDGTDNDGGIFYGDDESASATIENGAVVTNNDDGDLAIAGGLENGSGHSATVNVGSNVQLLGNVGGVGVRNSARDGEDPTTNASLVYNGNGGSTLVQGGNIGVVLQNRSSGTATFNNFGSNNTYRSTNIDTDPENTKIMGVGVIAASGTATFNNSGSGLFISGNDVGMLTLSQSGNAVFNNSSNATFQAGANIEGSIGGAVISQGGTADYNNTGSVTASGNKAGLVVVVDTGSGNADYSSTGGGSNNFQATGTGGVALGVIVQNGSGDALYNNTKTTTVTATGTDSGGIAVLNVDDPDGGSGSGDASYVNSGFTDVTATNTGSVGIGVISEHGSASYQNNGATTLSDGSAAGIAVLATGGGGGASYSSSGSTTVTAGQDKSAGIIVNVTGGSGNASYTSSAFTSVTNDGTGSVGIGVIAADSDDDPALQNSTGNASYTSSAQTIVNATATGSAGILVVSARGTATYQNNSGASATSNGARAGILVAVTDAGGNATYTNTGTTTATATATNGTENGAGILVSVAGGAGSASYTSSGSTTATATGINSAGILVSAADSTTNPALPDSTGNASYISSAFTNATATNTGSAGILVSSARGTATYQNNGAATAQASGARAGILVTVTDAGGNASYTNTGTTVASATEAKGAGILVSVAGGPSDALYTSSGSTTAVASGINSAGILVSAADSTTNPALPDSTGDASYLSTAFTQAVATNGGSAGILVSSARGAATYQNNNGAMAFASGARAGILVAVTDAGGNASYTNTGATTASANETKGAGILVSVSGGASDALYTSSGSTTATATGTNSAGILVTAADSTDPLLPDSTGDASYTSTASTFASATNTGSAGILVSSARGAATYQNNNSATAEAHGGRAGILVAVTDAGGNASYTNTGTTTASALETKGAGILVSVSGGASDALYTSSGSTTTTATGINSAGILVSAADSTDPLLPLSTGDASYISTAFTQATATNTGSAGILVTSARGTATYQNNNGATAQASGARAGILVAVTDAGGNASYTNTGNTTASANQSDGAGILVSVTGGAGDAIYLSSGITNVTAAGTNAAGIAVLATDSTTDPALPLSTGDASYLSTAFTQVTATNTDSGGITVVSTRGSASYVSTAGSDISGAQAGILITTLDGTGSATYVSTATALVDAVEPDSNGIVVASSGGSAGYLSTGVGTQISGVLSAVTVAGQTGMSSYQSTGATLTGSADGLLVVNEYGNVSVLSNDTIVGTNGNGARIAKAGYEGGITAVFDGSTTAMNGDGITVAAATSNPYPDSTPGPAGPSIPAPAATTVDFTLNGAVDATLSGVKLVASSESEAGQNSGNTILTATLAGTSSVTSDGIADDEAGVLALSLSTTGTADITLALNQGDGATTGVVRSAGNGVAAIATSPAGGMSDVDILGSIFAGRNGLVAAREGNFGGVDVYLGPNTVIDAGENGVIASQDKGSGGVVTVLSDARIIAGESGLLAINTGGSATATTNNLITAHGDFGAGVTTENGDATLIVNAAIDGAPDTGAGAIVQGNGNIFVDINAPVDANTTGVMGTSIAGTGNIDIDVDGRIRSDGTGILSVKNGDGDTTIDVNAAIGGLSAAATGASGIQFTGLQGSGDVSIVTTTQGQINASDFGITATKAFSDGNVNILTNATIEAGTTGINVSQLGSNGNVRVVSTQSITAGRSGINIESANGTGRIDVNFAPFRSITAGRDGIAATKDGLGTGGINVTVGQQATIQAGRDGIFTSNGSLFGDVNVTVGNNTSVQAGRDGVTALNEARSSSTTVLLGTSTTTRAGDEAVVASAVDNVLIDIGASSLVAGDTDNTNSGKAINVTGSTNATINLNANSTALGSGQGFGDAVVSIASTNSAVFNISAGSLVTSWSYFRTSPIAAASDAAINATGGATTVNNYGTLFGLVSMSNQNDVLNNFSSNTWVTVGENYFGGGNDLVNNVGRTVTAMQGGLAENTSFQGLETFQNGDGAGLQAGTLTMIDGDTLGMTAPRDITFTSGVFQAITAGPLGTPGNSRLEVDAYLGGPGTTADRLVIGGLDVNGNPVSNDTLVTLGQTEIFIADKNAGGVGAFNPDGILVVQIQNGATIGKNDPNGATPSFLISPDTPNWDSKFGGVLEKGLFFYDILVGSLDGGLTNDVFLVGVPDHEVFEMPVFVTGAQNIWYETSGLWLDRQADLRSVLINPTIVPGATIVTKDAGIVKAPPLVQKGIDGPGVWMKALGSWADREASSTYQIMNGTYTYDTSYNQHTYGLIGGIDLGKTTDTSTWMFGVMAGYISSSLNFKASETSGAYTGGTVGLYGTYINGGFFIDALAKADILKLDYNVPSLANIDYTGEKVDSNTYGFTIDSGYRFDMGNKSFVEPVATFSYATVDMGNLKGITDTDVSFDGESTRASLGLRVGGNLYESDAYWVEASGTARLWYEFDGDNTALIINPGAPFTAVDDFGGAFGEFTGSLNWFGRTNGLSAFANGSVKFNNDYTAGAAQLGVRYQW